MTGGRVAAMRRLCAGWVDAGETPALVVLVARRGVVVLHEAFGRLGSGGPALPVDALFPVGSLSKPVAAATVLTLVEEGMLGLNRPVQEYVPELVGEGKHAIMVHHLLTHTSGMHGQELGAHVQAKVERGELPPEPGLAYLLAGLDAPLWKQPGEEMSYLNEGYLLLGLIAERVAGRPFVDLAADRVLEPLGMRDSGYGAPVDPGRMIDWARGASLSPLLDPELRRRIGPAGGLVSTTWDIALFGQALLGGGTPILSRATVREMTRNQIPGVSARFESEYFPEASWGYGWDVQSEKKAPRGGSLLSPRAFGHVGGGGVYVWVDPELELVGAYFSVLAETRPGWYSFSCADLFVNAATAAVAE